MKLAVVGGGFMGEALIRAAVRGGVVAPADVRVAEISAERRATLADALGVATCADPASAPAGAALVVLAVKPQEFALAARDLRGKLDPSQTVVSIMAGVRIVTIADVLAHPAVVRVMPNTPAVVGEAMSVWCAAPAVAEPARSQVQALLRAAGREIAVADEKYIDMATALSGSGPGFVFLLMEALIDAGVHIGFRRDLAETLAVQTFLGASRYAAESGGTPARLRGEVTSPAGTTAAGVLALEQAGVRAAIIEAVQAAYDRARELGG